MSPNRSARLAVLLRCLYPSLAVLQKLFPSHVVPLPRPCLLWYSVLVHWECFCWKTHSAPEKKRICTSLFWAWLYLEDSLESKHISQDYFISRQMKSVGFFHMARQKQLLNRNIRQSWGTVDCLHMVIEQLKTYFQRSRVFRLSASFVSFIMYYSLKEPTHAHFEYLKQISECLRLSTHMCRYWIWGVCV